MPEIKINAANPPLRIRRFFVVKKSDELIEKLVNVCNIGFINHNKEKDIIKEQRIRRTVSI